MQNKLSSVIRANKLLFIGLGLSLLMLLVGAMLIMQTPPAPPENVPVNNQQDDMSLIRSLDDTETIINSATKGAVQAAPDDERLVRGSEPWCEAMMLKPDAEWNEADTHLFAQKCL